MVPVGTGTGRHNAVGDVGQIKKVVGDQMVLPDLYRWLLPDWKCYRIALKKRRSLGPDRLKLKLEIFF